MGTGGAPAFGAKASSGAANAESGSNQLLAQMATQFAEETEGLRTGLFGQLEEVLRTGGSQANVPIISKAVEASKLATSNTLREIDSDLASSGLAGTPFGDVTKAQARTSGNLATSQIPANFATQLLNLIPNLILGQAQTATGGLGTSATNLMNLTNTGLGGMFKTSNMGKYMASMVLAKILGGGGGGDDATAGTGGADSNFMVDATKFVGKKSPDIPTYQSNPMEGLSLSSFQNQMPQINIDQLLSGVLNSLTNLQKRG